MSEEIEEPSEVERRLEPCMYACRKILLDLHCPTRRGAGHISVEEAIAAAHRHSQWAREFEVQLKEIARTRQKSA